MSLYRYNHLHIRRLGPGDRAQFPQYPNPWVLLVDDRDIVLGDGASDDGAKQDYGRGREPNTPSPEALARLRRERQRRVRRRSG